MKELQEKNGKKIVDFFQNAFGDNFDIKCTWGFPRTVLEFVNTNGEIKTKWRIAVDLVEPNYFIESKSWKMEGEKEIAEWGLIDKNVINFIVGNITKINSEILENQGKQAESKTEKSDEDK